MTALADDIDVRRFCEVVRQRLGLQFDEARRGFLAEVAHRRSSALGLAGEAYLQLLQTAPCAGELGALADELTVPETYFFRNNDQFRALAEVVLPRRMRLNAATRTLRILSAACASGEEAYSIAIVARETIAAPDWGVSVRAVDVSPAVLGKARRARYSSWALRETPAEAQRKWFRADQRSRDLQLDEVIRRAVDFEQRNLAADDPELWAPEAFDVVFCRNVLMYFAPEQARATLARITRALAPGGYLFLGHAETLRGLSDDYHLRHTHEAFYYERKGVVAEDAAGPDPNPDPTPAPAPAITAAPTPGGGGDGAWVETIRRASERVHALVPAGGARVVAAPAAATRDLAAVFDLIRNERFDEALSHVHDLPQGPRDAPDALLLEAVLLAHGGAFAEAEAVCRRLLAIDPLNAGAHHALALCRESLGDRDGAAESDRAAIQLDPEFAMPRLHLGLLTRRAGDGAAARRDFGLALTLLQREDAARLLLFGGGFHRAALIELCRSALDTCGGRP